MRKALFSTAVAIAFAGAIAVSGYRHFEQPSAFKGCFDYKGSKLVLSDGRLMIDGVDAGSFRHSLGDATKGPDRIIPDTSSGILKTIGLDNRRVWFVADNGIQLPLDNGEYRTAPPCRT